MVHTSPATRREVHRQHTIDAAAGEGVRPRPHLMTGGTRAHHFSLFCGHEAPELGRGVCSPAGRPRPGPCGQGKAGRGRWNGAGPLSGSSPYAGAGPTTFRGARGALRVGLQRWTTLPVGGKMNTRPQISLSSHTLNGEGEAVCIWGGEGDGSGEDGGIAEGKRCGDRGEVCGVGA